VSPVKYELDFYSPEDAILHSQRRENLKSYIIQMICFLSSCHAAGLHSGEERASNMHFVFSVFASKPSYILASVNGSLFSLWYLLVCYLPIYSIHQHESAVCLLTSDPPGFPAPSLM
jgi:hypothetical protein